VISRINPEELVKYDEDPNKFWRVAQVQSSRQMYYIYFKSSVSWFDNAVDALAHAVGRASLVDNIYIRADLAKMTIPPFGHHT